MTDNGGELDRAYALHHFHEAIVELELCDLQGDDLQEIQQGMIRLYNLAKKHRSK